MCQKGIAKSEVKHFQSPGMGLVLEKAKEQGAFESSSTFNASKTFWIRLCPDTLFIVLAPIFSQIRYMVAGVEGVIAHKDRSALASK